MKSAVILGGTGTLGQALTRQLLASGQFVTVVSRCELKQAQMRDAFNRHPFLKFQVADIRDREGLEKIFSEQADYGVYHVAALKHVDIVEQNPEEAVKTNILGTINAANVAERYRADKFVFSSTDKAVDPINVYGMTKGISERILLARNGLRTKFSVFRWGNVLASRGSAIPKFVSQIKAGQPVEVTDPSMTRFWITIERAAAFMIERSDYASTQEVEIPEMMSASVADLLTAISSVLGMGAPTIKIIGNRGGEKMHEQIRSQHSGKPLSSDTAKRFTQQELMDLVRPFCI